MKQPTATFHIPPEYFDIFPPSLFVKNSPTGLFMKYNRVFFTRHAPETGHCVRSGRSGRKRSRVTESAVLSACLRTGGTLHRPMPCISGTPQSLTDSLITGTFKVYPVIGYDPVLSVEHRHNDSYA
jgi:hypothetical protein